MHLSCQSPLSLQDLKPIWSPHCLKLEKYLNYMITPLLVK